VTHVLTRDLSGMMQTLKIPAAQKNAVLAQATRGSFLGSGLGTGSNKTTEALARALKESFVSGMHEALVIAGIVLVVGAIVVGALVRKPSEQTQEHLVEDQSISEIDGT